MTRKLDKLFELKVKIPLMRHGKSHRIETLINEEALLLAKYLRDEKRHGFPEFLTNFFQLLCMHTRARHSVIVHSWHSVS